MTKPQKIEGGWDEIIKAVVRPYTNDFKVLNKERGNKWEKGQELTITEVVEIISTEIEKAKAEAYRAGLDFQKQSVEMIEKAVRASERQRCVEALPSEIGVRRGRDNLYDTPMGMMDMTDGEVEAFNQAIYQAKHNLEQLK